MAQYFDEFPEISSSKKLIDYRLNGVNFKFNTDNGVFCKNEVDHGTDILLKAVVDDIKASGPKKGTSVLDLGTGYGAIGIVIKSCFMAFNITGVDSNSRAISLAEENAALNRVSYQNLVKSDVLFELPAEDMFDIAITNPPIRAGKATVFRFYEEAYEHLNKSGILYVVIQRKQGAPSTLKKLHSLFEVVDTLDISGGYHVFKAVK